MKTINDQNIINQYIKKYNIDQIFRTLPHNFYVKEYDKNEIIISPLNTTTDFHFIVEGIVHIYSIHNDGSMFTLVVQDRTTLLGDMEYIDKEYTHFFVETKSPVKALCLKMDDCYKNDPLFLQFLLRSLAYKLRQSTHHQANYIDLKDKLIAYIKYNCKNKTLTHIEKTAMNLHCSRRHLQRVLSQLIEEKRLIKKGKGVYELIDS